MSLAAACRRRSGPRGAEARTSAGIHPGLDPDDGTALETLPGAVDRGDGREPELRVQRDDRLEPTSAGYSDRADVIVFRPALYLPRADVCRAVPARVHVP